MGEISLKYEPYEKNKVAKRSAETLVRPLSWEGVAVVFCLLLLFLLWFTSFFPEKRLWGINHWAYFPFWLRSAVIASALVFFIPRVQQKLAVFLQPLLIRFFDILTGTRKVWGYLSISAISLLIFYLFRAKTHFLGDGFQILDSIKSGSLTPNWSQPLPMWITLGLYHLFNPLINLDGASVYALVSYLAGIIFVIFALRLANLVGKNPSQRMFIFLILMLMGGSELFFGYAEHYPLFYSGILIYLFYSLKFLRGKTRVYVPLLIFLLLLPVHFTSIYLFPSLLFLLVSSDDERMSRQLLKNKRVWMGLLFLLILFSGAVMYMLNSDRFVFRHLMPVLHGGYAGPHYTFFSLDHIFDFLNQQLLSSPVGFVLCLLFLMVKPGCLAGKDRTLKFLLVVGSAQLLFDFIINLGLGAPRDWDLLASVGLGYTVLALYVFTRMEPESKPNHLKFKLSLVAFLFTLPWILINTNPEKSVARFRNLLDLDPKRSRNGHFILAGYFDRAGKPKEAEKENKKILEKFPELDLYLQGKKLLDQGEGEQARRKFEQSLQLSPEFPEGHAGLGLYYVNTGDYARSEAEYREAIKLNSNLSSAYSELGDVYMKKRDFKSAGQFYNYALKYAVVDPRVYNNLGILYVQLDDFNQAAYYYRKAIELEKNPVEPLSGLAFVYSEQGKFNEALTELDLLLEIDPNFAMAYYQQGSVYRSLGKKKEALVAFSRFVKMQPNNPKAAEVKQWMGELRVE
jgi:Flp pilus assembly protein TadD